MSHNPTLPAMRYRRFGRTELSMPVVSCGGMRYQQTWGDLAPEAVESAGQANLEACIHRALELGINHIETARGYGSSEMQLGFVLPQIERSKLIVQTKVGPNENVQEFKDRFETSMRNLQLDYVDLLSFHGINNDQLLEWTLRSGGCMDAARQYQREGRVRHIGFSTHAHTDCITRTCATGEFDYVNLHWYFVNELNWPSIEEAARQDMGVFIISPVDKGGRLQTPSPKMVELCQPLAPMQFNDLWCLQRPQVHTLSIGAARPSDFDAHLEALAYYDDIEATIAPIEAQLRAEMARVCGEEWCAHWPEGVPEYLDLPGQMNVREILRLWTYTHSFDLLEWGKSRYNLLGSGGHFFPGYKAGEVNESELCPLLQDSPFADRIPQVLREAHELLDAEAVKRLSQS